MNLKHFQVICLASAIALLVVVFELIPLPMSVVQFKWLAAIGVGVLVLAITATELSRREARAQLTSTVEEAVGIRSTKWSVLKRAALCFVVFIAVFPFVLIASYLDISVDSVADKLGMPPLALALVAILVTAVGVWAVARAFGWTAAQRQMGADVQAQGE